MSLTGIWDAITAGAWVLAAAAVVTVILWMLSRLGLFRSICTDLAPLTMVLLFACLIYEAPQIRELFWISYGPTRLTNTSSPSDVLDLMFQIFFTSLWVSFSIILLTITLIIWGPVKFYKISDIWRAVRQPKLHQKA